MPTITVGFDLATKTGWAVKQDDAILASGMQDFSKRRGESNGIMFLRFRRWALELLSDLPGVPIAVGYERAHFRGGAPTEIGVGLQTHLQGVCAELGIESVGVHTGTLKKFFCGGGKASKQDMIKEAATKIGRDPIDDNEADAVAVSCWTYNEFVYVRENTNVQIDTSERTVVTQRHPIRVEPRRKRNSR